jgi:predicted metalloenzyme YecM
LEKEQESLVNRLWKRMEKLETDKRLLQLKLEQPDQTHIEVKYHTNTIKENIRTYIHTFLRTKKTSNAFRF